MNKIKKLPYRFTLYISRAEKAKLNKFSHQHHMPRSKVIRTGLDSITKQTHIKSNRSHQRKIKRLKNQHKTENLSFEHQSKIINAQNNAAQAIHESTIQVSRIGNNINQITKDANKGNLSHITAQALYRTRKIIVGAESLNLKLENNLKRYFRQVNK